MSNIYAPYKDIGERIKKLRKENKMTQEELSAQMEVCRKNVIEWEKGTRLTLPFEDMIKLCCLFGCDIGYLLGEYDTKRHEAADVQKIIGLSEKAINVLQKHHFYEQKFNREVIEFLNIVIESKDFVNWALAGMDYIMESALKQRDVKLLKDQQQEANKWLEKNAPHEEPYSEEFINNKKLLGIDIDIYSSKKLKPLKDEAYKLTKDFDKLIENLVNDSKNQERAIELNESRCKLPIGFLHEDWGDLELLKPKKLPTGYDDGAGI